MTTRTHHPACPARNGGLCFNCPPTEKPRTASPAIHLSCARCGEQYVALGLTDDIAARAANAGPTCCIQTAGGSGEQGKLPDPSAHVPVLEPTVPFVRLRLAALLLAVGLVASVFVAAGLARVT